MKTALAWVAGVLLAFIIGGAIAVGGWKLHWWLYKANLNNQYRGNVNSQQYQAGLVDAERNRVQGYDTSDSTAQKHQIAMTFCAQYLDLNPPPTDLVAAYSRICPKEGQ